MASLYIKDQETADLVTRVAQKSGLTKTALVRQLAAAREFEIDEVSRRQTLKATLDALHAAQPLPPRTGTPADKAFFDDMWGEDAD